MSKAVAGHTRPRARITYFLRVFLPAALLVLLAVAYLKREDERRVEAQLQAAQEVAVRLGVETLAREVDGARRDAQLMVGMQRLQAALADPSPERLADVTRDFQLFARVQQAYERVRWIDPTGRERISVALAGEEGKVVPAGELRTLQDRYYVSAGERLNPGEVFLSGLDRSHDGREAPSETAPVVRVVTPLFDGKGVRRGLLVLDLRAEAMLARFADVTRDSPGRTWILNGSGFAIGGTARAGDPSDPLAQRASLRDTDAPAWEQIRASPQGAWRSDSGTWVWRAARPAEDTESWIVASFVPRGGAMAGARPYQRAHIIVGLAALLFISGVGWVLASTLQGMAQSRAALEAQAVTDALTGLGNRRGFFAKLAELWSLQRRRPDIPVGVLMLDLDHFKSVNDQHGHRAGDDVLREFGQRLAGAIRTTDFAARLGGEEFGVILSGSNREGIAQFAERFRAEVASRAFKAGGETLSITVSLGGASMQAEDTSPEQALERADKNLYRAKEAGRNRVDLG